MSLDIYLRAFLEPSEKKKEEKPDEKLELSSKTSSLLNIKPNSGVEMKPKRLHLEIPSIVLGRSRQSVSPYSSSGLTPLSFFVGKKKSSAADEDDNISKKSFELPPAEEKNQIIRAINEFYENHEEGPAQLVERLIEKFKSMTFQEKSLRTLYENLSDSVIFSIA